MACVYQMIIGDAFYIGSTKNIHVRIRSWKQHIVEGISQNRNVTKALENTDKVVFEILEVVTDGEHQKHEEFYLNKYWGDPLLLNLSKNPYTPCGYSQTEEQKEVRRWARNKYGVKPEKKPVGFNSKKILQFDKGGNLVQTHKSIRDAAKYVGAPSRKPIQRIVNGKAGCKSYKGYTFSEA